MRKTILAVGLAIAMPQVALAQAGGAGTGDTQMKGGKGATGKTDEPKKHLMEIDASLKNAMNETKVLYEISRLPAGKMDASLQKEDTADVERAIGAAMTHVNHIKSMPEAKVGDMTRVDQLRTDLTQARNLTTQLKRSTGTSQADRAQFQALTSQLYATLKTADDHFGQIAQEQGLTRIDRLDVPERQPVGGPSEEMEPGMEKQPRGTGGTMDKDAPQQKGTQQKGTQPSPGGGY